MTVNELIEKLQQIEDKEIEVYIADDHKLQRCIDCGYDIKVIDVKYIKYGYATLYCDGD